MGIDHIAVWVLGIGLGWMLHGMFMDLRNRLQKVTWKNRVIWERKTNGS